jgi:hypothetical protein
MEQLELYSNAHAHAGLSSLKGISMSAIHMLNVPPPGAGQVFGTVILPFDFRSKSEITLALLVQTVFR